MIIVSMLQIFLPNILGNKGPGALELSSSNHDNVIGQYYKQIIYPMNDVDFLIFCLANNELVLINFYADWCRFSALLAPQFDEAADKIRAKFPELGKVVMGKVDSDKECKSRFRI